mgnify:CR=1 FL=1
MFVRDASVGTDILRRVISDTLLRDQDGRGGNSDQPVSDFPQAEEDM